MNQPKAQSSQHYPLIILGAGSAGYTAAIYAARAQLEPLLITMREPGGALVLADHVLNWPGGETSSSGKDLMQRMHDQAMNLGTCIQRDVVTEVRLDKRPFVITGERASYSCDALVIATGGIPRLLDLPSVHNYLRKGVMPSSYSQGPDFKDKHVLVVGGGNVALTEALYLSDFARQVTLTHRRDHLRAEKTMVREWLTKVDAGEADVLWSHVLDEVKGNGQYVTGARLRHVENGQIKDFAIDELILATGLRPNTDLFRGQLDMKNGYIQVQQGANRNYTATSVSGVFAAGDVMNSTYRQAIVAAGSGCMAALDAENYLRP